MNKPIYFEKLQIFLVHLSHLSRLNSCKNATTSKDHTVTEKYKLNSLY